MKNKVSINDRSIESAGIPKDYKDAIAELIWNGFDAGASRVELEYDANEIEFVNQLIIRDNGNGIRYDDLSRTFGTLLDSIKNVSYQRSSYVHGQKGKGRFSFTTFARRAQWNTIVNPEGQPYEYSIVIHSRNKDEYELTEQKLLSHDTPSGTEVILTNLFGVTASSFHSDAFMQFLCQQFGWFLFLNRKNHFALTINGEELNYSNIIAEYDVRAVILDDGEEDAYSFDLTFIRWKTRIGDRYYYYFLNQKKRECAKQLTSFNNNAIDFHHSVYIESDFFKDFLMDQEDPGSRLIGKNQSHPVFRALIKELHSFLEEKEQQFIQKEAATRLVREYNVLGIMPSFGQSAFDRTKRDELEEVIRELYSIQPKLFKSLRREQQKAFVGMLNLLMDSSDRSKVIEVLEQVSPLKEEERHRLSSIFAKNDTHSASQSLKLIEDRHKTIALLQQFCESELLFESEKPVIHNLMAENYWLLGEQYHLVTPNRLSEDFFYKSLTILDGKKSAAKNAEKQGRFDREAIFVARQRLIADGDNIYGKKENILLDLKSPTYTLTQADNRQANAYLRFIIKDPQHNGAEQVWKFFLIGKEVDAYIKGQYTAQKAKGKPFLIQALRNYEIYALTWRDLFGQFSNSHNHILANQSTDRKTLEKALLDKGIRI